MLDGIIQKTKEKPAVIMLSSPPPVKALTAFEKFKSTFKTMHKDSLVTLTAPEKAIEEICKKYNKTEEGKKKNVQPSDASKGSVDLSFNNNKNMSNFLLDLAKQNTPFIATDDKGNVIAYSTGNRTLYNKENQAINTFDTFQTAYNDREKNPISLDQIQEAFKETFVKPEGSSPVSPP